MQNIALDRPPNSWQPQSIGNIKSDIKHNKQVLFFKLCDKKGLNIFFSDASCHFYFCFEPSFSGSYIFSVHDVTMSLL